MSSTLIYVDDTSSSIVYAGSWAPISHTGAGGSSLHQTTTAGSSLTLSYIGSPSVTLFGSIGPCVPNLAAPVYQLTMDGQTGQIIPIICNDQFQNGLSVTVAAAGPSGVNAKHIVTLTSLGGSRNLPFMFDFIEYSSFAGQSSSTDLQAKPPSTAVTAVDSATPSPTPTSFSPPMGVFSTISSQDTITRTAGSAFTNVTITQLTTINGVATSIAVVTTSTNVLTTSNPSSTSVTRDVAAVGKSRTRLVGPIVGAVLGVAVLCTILLLFLRRRRRSYRLTSKPAEGIEPFHLDQNTFPERTRASLNRPSTSTAQPSSMSPPSETDFENEKATSGSPSQAHHILAHQIPGSDLLSSSPSTNQQFFHTSLALSDTSPADTWTLSASRPQYHSGLTSLDVPPSYNSVQNPGSKIPSAPHDLAAETN
ncbi:hypothetical protein GALMADRAFT_161694 [Galerina marginata CBS 339.88]|uniref:Mid2 domain-containing protein n=1 Tax=Galerina marginata (strain CBS 339.88) TaxID=685588 RepID=A0A067S8T9_GALM3|nr:hypothetical protein GALMADRAFT_161694 [Galerina marginata CBS 339.88]